MSSSDKQRNHAVDVELRRALGGLDSGGSVWPAVRSRIGGRTPLEIERGERVAVIRRVAAVAAVLLLTLQLVWHIEGHSSAPAALLDRLEPSRVEFMSEVLDEVLVPTESAEFDPSTVLTLLVDGE
ncbi:MAG: hypothetical protein RL885_04700 [Planctomycetota bacterium]